MKKKTPTEIIEETQKPMVEHMFLKYPRKNPEEIGMLSTFGGSMENPFKAVKTFYKNDKKDYSKLHTHPSYTPIKLNGETELIPYYSSSPSKNDLENFLRDKNAKSTIIAVREPHTGKVQGYYFLSKTKKTPKLRRDPYGRIFDYFLWKIGKKESTLSHDLKLLQKKLYAYQDIQEFLEKYHLNQRIIPTKGYKIGPKLFWFEKEGAPKPIGYKSLNLESKFLASISIAGFIGSIFFLSPNFNGNVVGNLAVNSSNVIGGILFIVGLIGALFYFKRK